MALAREGLSPADRRAALRAVRRGAAVDDPEISRLAVALARDGLRRSEWLGLQLVVAAILGLGFSAECIASAVHRGGGVETAAYGLMAALALGWLIRGFGRSDRWRRAEAANRAVLEHAGKPFIEDTTLVTRARSSVVSLLLDAAIQWIVTDLAFGALAQASHAGALTIGHLVRRGLIFASALTAWTLFDQAFPQWRAWLHHGNSHSSPGSKHDAK